jgi:branched-chain amino acid transport system ATP-binding protein
MLAIPHVLRGKRHILLMDEPSEGLAPVVVEQLVEVIKVLARDNSLALLIVEQRVDIALDAASRRIRMDRERISFEAQADTLRNDDVDLSVVIGLSM